MPRPVSRLTTVGAVRIALMACIVATVAACGAGDPLGPSLATTGPTAESAAGRPSGVAQTDAPGDTAAPLPDTLDAVPAPPPPTAPTLTVQGKSGALSLTWTASVAATSYTLQKTLDAGGTWTAVGAPLPAGSSTADVKVPVAEWARASVRVLACNAGGCTASAAMTALQPLAATLRHVKASNTGANDYFGISVALSADGATLAVGAYGEDSAGTGTTGTGTDDLAPDSGAVYVFVRSAGTWSQQAYLKASNTGAGDAFGVSVALSADAATLAIGAYYEDSAGTGTAGTGADDLAQDSGAVYVF